VAGQTRPKAIGEKDWLVFRPGLRPVEERVAGAYWSASRYSGNPKEALSLLFGGEGQRVDGSIRYTGFTVRPVCE